MLEAIHIEFDVFSLVVMGVMIKQVIYNANRQASKRIFLILVMAVFGAIMVDAMCTISDGKHFIGARVINNVANAMYFSLCSIIGAIWSKFVILRVQIKYKRIYDLILAIPAIVVTGISFASIHTGWIFEVTTANDYIRGPLFPVHLIVSYGYLGIVFFYLLYLRIAKKFSCAEHTINFMLIFYILPIIGSVFSTMFSGMPGLWQAAAMSTVMVYIDMQDEAVLTDGLTGLNNRKVLKNSFQYYVKNLTPETILTIYMIDLNKFKQINDTYGHVVGDEALVNAASILKQFVSGTELLLVRYGGDEFFMIGLLHNEKQAEVYKEKLLTSFDNWNRDNQDKPYKLLASVGYQIYHEGDTLEGLVAKADDYLYKDKKKSRRV